MASDHFELPDDAAIDFREPAVRESLRIVAANGGVIPSNRSLCLPVGDSAGDSLRAYGWGTLLLLIIGVAGLVTGALLALLESRREGEMTWLLAVAGCASVGGILILLSSGFFQRRFTRRQIGQRFDNLLASATGSKPVGVGLEQATSYHRLKLVPEDLAFLVCDPVARMVKIEGVRHRYWIQANDVLSVGQIPGGTSTATAIAYAVGEAQLAIALERISLWHELKKQTVGVKHDSLLRVIQRTLGKES